MRVSEDSIRLFALNNQLLDIALRGIEEKYGIELGRGASTPSTVETSYYPQIESRIRAEASSMAPHYEMFYSLEKSIRGLLVSAFEAVEHADWWSSELVPANIAEDVKNRIQRDKDMGMTLRSESEIDFCTFGELGELIRKNWELFSGMLTSKRAVERVLSQLNSIRGPIAHCSPLAEDEVVRLRLAVRDWFRLME